MSVITYSACLEREREIARLSQKISELQQENQGLREELATARRESNRQAAPFRRRQLK